MLFKIFLDNRRYCFLKNIDILQKKITFKWTKRKKLNQTHYILRVLLNLLIIEVSNILIPKIDAKNSTFTFHKIPKRRRFNIYLGQKSSVSRVGTVNGKRYNVFDTIIKIPNTVFKYCC